MIPTSSSLHRYCLSLLIALLVCVVMIAPVVATTEVHLVRYASDRTTVLSEKTVSADWMSQNLPVLGDGVTHYYLQGPTFDQNNLWDPAESKNVQDKDMGAVKGTNLRDLCALVGGMAAGDTLEVRAEDGFSKQFAYSSVYAPQSRQGPIGLVWYNAAEGMVPAYQTGMRIIFFADTSVNPWHLHAFGNSDMQATLPSDEWHYFNGIYPTTTGLSVQSIQEIRIYSSVAPQAATTQQTVVPVQTTSQVTQQSTASVTPTQIPVTRTVSQPTTAVIPGTTQTVIPVTTATVQSVTSAPTVLMTTGSTSTSTTVAQVSTVVQQTTDAGQSPISSVTALVPANNTNTTVAPGANTTTVTQAILSAGSFPVTSVPTENTPVSLVPTTTLPTTMPDSGVALTSGITYTLGTSQENITQAPTLLTGQNSQTTSAGQARPTIQPTTAVPKSRTITGSVNLSFNLTAGGSSGSVDPLTTGVSTLLLWPLPVQTHAASFFEAFWWITRVFVH